MWIFGCDNVLSTVVGKTPRNGYKAINACGVVGGRDSSDIKRNNKPRHSAVWQSHYNCRLSSLNN